MLGWMKRHKILTGLLALLLIPVTLGGLNYSGMCIPEGRWLSDEEKIRVAASAVANNGPNFNLLNDNMMNIKPEGWDKFRNYESEYSDYKDPKIWQHNEDGSYTRIGTVDVDEFTKENPNCCKAVGRSNGHPMASPTFWTKIIGAYNDIVEVRYTAKFLDKQDNIVEFKDYTEYPIIKNCGYVESRMPD